MEHKPWLSLPDEDPPERGFAELMAAARAKAEVMANPPWWKRLAELLKRPPVLALATVVVLIGGVIIVHREPAEVSAPVASPPPASETVPTEPGGFGVAQPPPPPVEHRSDRAERLENAPIAGKKDKAAESSAESKLARPATGHVETGSVEVDLVPKGQAEEAPIVGGVANDPASQTRTVDDAVKQQVDGAAVKQPARRGELSKKPLPPPADSLARCRSAAANKDCAGARACAKQIESESPAFYKANVATDATLKPCL
jgi:hypothetical protein